MLIAEVIQEGFLGEDGFELNFGGWLLVSFDFISNKNCWSFFPQLLWKAVLEVCALIEAGPGRTSLSPVGSFSCRTCCPWMRWESRAGPVENGGEEETLGPPQSADGWGSRRGCLGGE